MKVEVYLTPEGLTPGSLRGAPVVVIDVLRTSTTIAAALAAGARGIYPSASTDDALRLTRDLGGDAVLLAGERRGLPVPGFDLGNSPREMTAERVGGRRLVLATTNGTPALSRTVGADVTLVGAAVNFRAVEHEARSLLADRGRLVIVCAGRESRFAMEDAYAAGRFVLSVTRRRRRVALDDGAQAALAVAERWGTDWLAVLERSAAASMLTEAGMADDIAIAATMDRYPVVPRLRNGMVQ